MREKIKIARHVLARMAEEARRSPGLECCGLLAGRDGVITEIFPAANALASATQFEIAPAELFRIFRAMRATGLDHLGIYHSHPAGPPTPSATEVERAFYPDAAYFILAPGSVKAFVFRDGTFVELEVKVV